MSTDSKLSLSELSRILARVSQSEHNYASKTSRRIASDAKKLEDNLIELEYQIRQQKLATRESLEAVRSIRVELPKKIFVETERLRTFLDRRKRSDDTFSVCLFGRTNAGKSTLREAITGGDGSTIGQGEQRTTQEVTNYDWEGIQLLDTPGLAAFDGSDDESTAWKAIDRTDLVLFMIISDSIQVSESEQFLWLRDRNKPVLFVLNVKHDVDHPVRRKKFLKQKTDTVSLKGQAGHVTEIRERSQKYLGHSNARIVPVHANAAYLARNETNISQREALREASRIDSLLDAVKDVARTHGKSYRIQAYRDELIHTLRNLQSELDEQVNALSKRLSHDKSEQDKLEAWFDDFEDRSIARITSHVENIFEDKLYSEVDTFIDRYAGQKKADYKFKKKIQNLDIASSVKKSLQPIATEAKNKVEEHIRQSEFNEKALDLEFETSISDLKREHAGAIMDVGAAILDVVAIVTGGLTRLLGTAIRGIKWLLDIDDRKKHRKKRTEAKRRLKSKIKKKEQKVERELVRWFDKNIGEPFKTNIKGGARSVLRAQEQALNEMQEYQREVEKTRARVQNVFMNDLIRIHATEESEFIFVERVARKQGQAAKLLVEGATTSHIQTALAESLGESVDIVQADIPVQEQVWQAVASVDPKSIRKKANGWNVTLSSAGTKNTTERACKVHGELASRLLQTSVTVKASSGASVSFDEWQQERNL